MSARSIKSAERTLALFELFSCREGPLTVSEVSHGLDIPQPSASMLLRNLTHLGYLDYDRKTRRFMPTIRVVLLGSWISRRLPASIVERLEELKTIYTGGDVFAAIQNNAAIQCILMFAEDLPDRMSVSSGRLRTLTCSAAGRALLSLRTDAEVVGWVRRCNAEEPDPRLRVNEADFLQVIAQVRQQGYAATEETSSPGRYGVAVALQPPPGSTPFAVGCGGPGDSLLPHRERLIGELLKVQASFGKAMRAQGSIGLLQ
jgi:DNA-binding IclR family transcriptional regulator